VTKYKRKTVGSCDDAVDQLHSEGALQAEAGAPERTAHPPERTAHPPEDTIHGATPRASESNTRAISLASPSLVAGTLLLTMAMIKPTAQA
jgi:hypothetical protein